MKTDLKNYHNSERRATQFKSIIWYFINLCFISNKCNPINSLKIWILRKFGAKIGKGVIIKPGVNIKYPWLLSIGNYSWIGEDVWIDNLGYVSIGSNCCISQGAMLLCGNHNFKKSTFDLIVKHIILEDGVWIGAQTTVCPGVVARNHSVLTVGSVISSEMESYGIYRGNPAKLVKQRQIT